MRFSSHHEFAKISLIAAALVIPAVGMSSSAAYAAEKWIAVAVDGKGKWGYGHNFATAGKARKAALDGCGSGCRVDAVGQSRCLAFVESRSGGYWYGIGVAESESGALGTARRGCRNGAVQKDTCRVVKALCG